MYEHESSGVKISVMPDYLEDESDPDEGRYVWAYTIEIENTGHEAVQLLARKWVITDSMGRTEHVQGEGVVGEQPLIEPGASYDYVSGCPLATPTGAMQGSYHVVSADGDAFDVAIPRFALTAPAIAG